MKIGRILILSSVLTPLFISCEDVLETKTVNEWDENKVWNLSDLAQGVLMQAYSAIPNTPNCFDINFLDVATDNAVTNSYASNIYKAAIGGITGADNPIGNWDVCYKQMQNIHEFMEKGLRDDYPTTVSIRKLMQQSKNGWKAKLYFFVHGGALPYFNVTVAVRMMAKLRLPHHHPFHND